MKDRRGDANQVRAAGGNDPNADFEAPKCLCGRVMNVLIWEAKQWAFIQKPGTSAYFKAGMSIRVRNAMIRSDNELCKSRIDAIFPMQHTVQSCPNTIPHN